VKPFEWVQPSTVAEAIAALEHPGSMPLAGGVDLLDRLKEHIVAPSRLVSLRKLPDFSKIEVQAGAARIGAGVTLAQLASDLALAKSHAIVGEAASHAATPQLRAMATLGGNFAQRPRCWYFRNETFNCKKKGGKECFAQTGENELHAIYGNKLCAATHPSTIVTALYALGASVTIAGKKGATREVSLDNLFVAPETDIKREIDLAAGELITAISIPPSKAKAAYTKQVAKQSFDWPIVDCAVALVVSGGKVESARIVLGAVAPTPLRASDAEKILTGKTVDEATAREAARVMVQSATPLSGNAYKVPIVEAVIARTILNATRAP